MSSQHIKQTDNDNLIYQFQHKTFNIHPHTLKMQTNYWVLPEKNGLNFTVGCSPSYIVIRSLYVTSWVAGGVCLSCLSYSIII